MTKRLWVLYVSIVGLFCSTLAVGADYPTKTVTLVSTFAPGGPSDTVARIVGKKLSELLGQNFLIENRPGAGGNIAAESVAKATPDGYTLMLGDQACLIANGILYKKLNYNAEKDFTPITLVGTQANILVVNPSVPARTLSELIALAKVNPGKLNYATGGYGAAAHLATELLKTRAGIEIVHVAYKGSAPALQDLLGGQVQMMFLGPTVAGQVRSGAVRALAVTTPARTAILPDVPTVSEAGLPGFNVTMWHGLVAPSATPRDIVATLARATSSALRDPGVQAALMKVGVDVVADPREDFASFIRSERPKWEEIVKASGARLD